VPSALLGLALAALPLDRTALDAAADRLALELPGARALPAEHGGLRHLSAVAARPGAGGAGGARAFLETYGGSFGVATVAELELLRADEVPGADGVALFRRRALGLPVFLGEIAVGWRADGAVTVVNGSPALATRPATEFTISDTEARAAALFGLPGATAEARAEPGWLEHGGALHPAWRVEHATDELGGHGLSYVHGATGELLWRASRVADLRPCATAPCARGFLLTPIDPPTPDPAGNRPRDFALDGLPAGAAVLDGQRTAVFNCQGLDLDAPQFFPGGGLAPNLCTVARQAPAPCGGAPFQEVADADGSFLSAPDPTGRDVCDPFPEQNAYLHVDAHSRWLDGLDAAFASRTPAGGIGFIPAFVNVRQSGGPFDNAFFVGGTGSVGQPAKAISGAMFFGQGTLVDFANDATVVYHELSHAAVDVSAGYQPRLDAAGTDLDPGALNEGTADALSAAHQMEVLAGDGLAVDSASTQLRYVDLGVGLFTRELSSPYTCRGNGQNDFRNPGRLGEVHDDGRIWGSFAWALLRAAHDREAVAPGTRQGMAQALFKALLASGPNAGFADAAATVRQKAQDVLGADGADFVACTIAQRDMDGCAERSVPMYSGERTEVPLRGLSARQATAAAAQQLFIDVPCGAVALHLQTFSRIGTSTVYVRYGRPVAFPLGSTGEVVADWAVTGEQEDVRIGTGEGSNVCLGSKTPFGAGRWYLAFWGGTSRNAVTVGLSIEMPPGQAPPARQAYLFGNGAGDPNRCAWSGGPTPQPLVPPAYAAPPSLGSCTPPAPPSPPPPRPPFCVQARPSPSTGCSCGPGEPASALVALLALGFLLPRRRGSLSGRRDAW